MKFLILISFLLLFNNSFNAQEDSITPDISFNWIEQYYSGDTLLKKRLQSFYKDLNQVSNPFDTEELFYELRDLCEALTHGVDLDEDDGFESYENDMFEAILVLETFNLPGFDFTCAGECTMFYVRPNYEPIITAASNTQGIQDDIALKIITDTWGVVEDESPSFQMVECCACLGSNRLGSGEQYALLRRINQFSENYAVFIDELESIKSTMKNYILYNDGFPMDDAAVIDEFNLIRNELSFNEKELDILMKKDIFQSIALNYSIEQGQFYVNGKQVPIGCIAQLKTELNGDNSQAVIYLDRTSLRGCMNSNIAYPGGNEDALSYNINESLSNDIYKITVFEAVDGSLGGSADKIIVQFVKRDYLLDDGEKIYVLSLSKIGDWK